MKIQNPFESGHIKNYILAYVGVVVITVLFFFTATIWRDVEEKPKKEFQTTQKQTQKKLEEIKQAPKKTKVKLINTPYN